MAFHRFESPDFWESTCDPSLQWTQQLAAAANLQLTAMLMGDKADSPMAQILRLPPHAVVSRHAHMCHRIEVIVLGSLIVNDDLVLKTGDVMTSPPGEFYGPHTAGPDGCLSVEIFSDATAPVEFTDPELSEVSRVVAEARRAAREAENTD